AHLSVLHTPTLHPLDTAPRLPSGTTALLRSGCKDPARTFRPSGPLCPHILFRHSLRRCTTLLSSRPLLPPSALPTHTLARCLSAFRSARFSSSPSHRTSSRSPLSSPPSVRTGLSTP